MIYPLSKSAKSFNGSEQSYKNESNELIINRDDLR